MMNKKTSTGYRLRKLHMAPRRISLKSFLWIASLFSCCEAAVEECKRTTLGTEYKGHMNKTSNNFTCQPWKSQTPWNHSFPNFEANYCRNPDNEPRGPWCYTTDVAVRWQYCPVSFCSSSTVTAPRVETTHAITKNGIMRTATDKPRSLATESSRMVQEKTAQTKQSTTQNGTYTLLSPTPGSGGFVSKRNGNSSVIPTDLGISKNSPTYSGEEFRSQTSSANGSTARTTVSSSQVPSRCYCSCMSTTLPASQANHSTNAEEQTTLEERLTKLVENLQVEKKQLSSIRRKKTSASDSRPSAVSMGYLGIAVLVVIFGTIALLDLIKLFFHVCLLMQSKKKDSNK